MDNNVPPEAAPDNRGSPEGSSDVLRAPHAEVQTRWVRYWVRAHFQGTLSRSREDEGTCGCAMEHGRHLSPEHLIIVEHLIANFMGGSREPHALRGAMREILDFHGETGRLAEFEGMIVLTEDAPHEDHCNTIEDIRALLSQPVIDARRFVAATDALIQTLRNMGRSSPGDDVEEAIYDLSTRCKQMVQGKPTKQQLGIDRLLRILGHECDEATNPRRRGTIVSFPSADRQCPQDQDVVSHMKRILSRLLIPAEVLLVHAESFKKKISERSEQEANMVFSQITQDALQVVGPSSQGKIRDDRLLILRALKGISGPLMSVSSLTLREEPAVDPAPTSAGSSYMDARSVDEILGVFQMTIDDLAILLPELPFHTICLLRTQGDAIAPHYLGQVKEAIRKSPWHGKETTGVLRTDHPRNEPARDGDVKRKRGKGKRKASERASARGEKRPRHRKKPKKYPHDKSTNTGTPLSCKVLASPEPQEIPAGARNDTDEDPERQITDSGGLLRTLLAYEGVGIQDLLAYINALPGRKSNPVSMGRLASIINGTSSISSRSFDELQTMIARIGRRKREPERQASGGSRDLPLVDAEASRSWRRTDASQDHDEEPGEGPCNKPRKKADAGPGTTGQQPSREEGRSGRQPCLIDVGDGQLLDVSEAPTVWSLGEYLHGFSAKGVAGFASHEAPYALIAREVANRAPLGVNDTANALKMLAYCYGREPDSEATRALMGAIEASMGNIPIAKLMEILTAEPRFAAIIDYYRDTQPDSRVTQLFASLTDLSTCTVAENFDPDMVTDSDIGYDALIAPPETEATTPSSKRLTNKERRAATRNHLKAEAAAEIALDDTDE